ncbi:hypothetical protein H6784_05560 [Candidatus Nomurabacteria bacterium]|nr:hypothetical protein [Candidatus Nomurabacteria bacterium]
MRIYDIKLSSGFVWILSGLALLTYGFLGLTHHNVPGVEEFLTFVNSASSWHLYTAVFIAIFFEGLYFIGSFFPGTSFVLLITIISQSGGITHFLTTILTIFIGWSLAGIINVFGAKYFYKKFGFHSEILIKLDDQATTTWFPTFRANTEVALITEGHKPKEVIMSSLRVKMYACLGVIIYTLLIPVFIDIQQLKNEEGFGALGLIALISFTVGGIKIYKSSKQKTA